MVSLRQLFQAPARRVARLGTLITDYDAKVHALESLPSPPRPSLQSTQRVWDAAMARDRLARALKVCEIPGPDAVEQIASHDQRLKQQATRLEKLVEQKTLVGWRETLGAAPEAWWWSLDEHLVASRRPIELPLLRWRIPLTWSWHLLRTCAWHWFVAGVPWAVLTVAAAFMAEVARRGLAGNPDLLTAFIALAQGAVALFTANQLIARRGQTPAPADRRGLQAPPGDGWRLLGAGMLLAAAWLLYAWGLPRLSGLYFDRGDEAFNFRTVNDLDDPNYADSHQPVTAIEHLQRAVSLDPSNAEAHYRLGLLYGRLLDVDRASSSFRAAMAGRQGPVLYAPINLSVVLLESEKYAQALEVLNIPPALDHAEGNAFAYLLDRQRGWALLGLTHYEE